MPPNVLQLLQKSDPKLEVTGLAVKPELKLAVQEHDQGDEVKFARLSVF